MQERLSASLTTVFRWIEIGLAGLANSPIARNITKQTTVRTMDQLGENVSAGSNRRCVQIECFHIVFHDRINSLLGRPVTAATESHCAVISKPNSNRKVDSWWSLDTMLTLQKLPHLNLNRDLSAAVDKLQDSNVEALFPWIARLKKALAITGNVSK